MIKSFADKNTEKLYITGKSKKFDSRILRIAMRKMEYLNGAEEVEDLRSPPGNHLELLKGNFLGKYSIRINQQYRIIFEFEKNNAYDVEIIDYH